MTQDPSNDCFFYFFILLPQDASNDGVRAVAVRGHPGKPPRELVVREGDLVKDTKTKMQQSGKMSSYPGQRCLSGGPLVVPWGGSWGSRIGPGAMHSSDHFYPRISLLVIPDDEDDDDDGDGGDRY